MSGSSLPYHLRQNKAIDRNLFCDLLKRIALYKNISEYTYIGFGGPFLEDFRQIHSATRIGRMISLEIDDNVYSRQRFNLPISCIELRRQSCGDFLTDYDFPGNYVVWLDYTRAAEVGIQLAELETLVTNIPEDSIFKITLNAHAACLGSPNDGSDLQNYRANRAAALLGPYGPANISADDVTARNYPRLLSKAIEAAAKRGVIGRPRCRVLPLTSFSYKDGQTMLTTTCIVLKKIDETPFITQTRLGSWPFASLQWAEPAEISVPEMSFRERMFIESLLPETDSNEIRRRMEYYIGDTDDEASEQLANFVKYYRMYPWYSRVAI